MNDLNLTLDNHKHPTSYSDKVDRILEEINSIYDGHHDAPTLPQAQKPHLSFVIPVHDEEQTIAPLTSQIRANIASGVDYEILLIDDGSNDESWTVIRSLCQKDPAHLRGIKFRHNAGKATSLAAGFQASRGDLVFTLDADLQDDPREIPRFLEKMREGYDLVSGWKKIRRDPWTKVVPSRCFNWIASAVGGVKLHDHNCGFKCYRSDVIKRLSLHGELHRVIPTLANMQGFRCSEIEVLHHPRQSGRSKYGVARFLHGFCDIITSGFLRRYRQRPAHFFNAVAGMQAALGIALIGLTYCFASKQMLTALLVATLLFCSAGLGVLLGLLSELVIRGPLPLSNELPIEFDTGVPSPTTLHQEHLPQAE